MDMAGKQDARTAALVVGPDGVVSGWSESGRLLLGWTAEDAVGRPVTDLLAAPPPPGFPESYGSGPDHTELTPCATGTVPRWTLWCRLTRCSAPTAGHWAMR